MAVETKGTMVSHRNIPADYFRWKSLSPHCTPVKPGNSVMLRAAPGPPLF